MRLLQVVVICVCVIGGFLHARNGDFANAAYSVALAGLVQVQASTERILAKLDKRK